MKKLFQKNLCFVGWEKVDSRYVVKTDNDNAL